MDIATEVDELAHRIGFSGTVRVDVGDDTVVARSYGFANRALQIPNAVDTIYGTASGGKGVTALTVMSLVEDGTLRLDTTARSLLGDDLPVIDDRVTIEHLLGHTSGIGDYSDEEVDRPEFEYTMTVPVHELADTEDYLAVLDGHANKFDPGERAVYCNGGYVVLALLAERASGVPFHRLVDERVCRPAGMVDTGFPRSDELPARAALGYLDDGPRTNVFHLPVRGSGDGGLYTTAADMRRFWDALFAGRIVSPESVAMMTTPRHEQPGDALWYGLGFWVDPVRDTVSVHGFDVGATFVSRRQRQGRYTATVLANMSRGAWPMSQRIEELLT